MPERTQGNHAMTAQDNTKARRAAVAMLKAGTATMSEVAALAGVSRQVVQYWAKAAGINCAQARNELLRRVWITRLRS